MLKEWRTYNKALWGFVVAFVGALVAEVNAGSPVNAKSLLLALGTAVATGGFVYQARNKE